MPCLFKTLILLSAGLPAFYLSFGQQANNWYFGDHAGLSFNSSPPAVLTDGAINTAEGCASVSDEAGKLLFYTDGITVWNSLHQPMPNGTGLHGNFSSANSAVIVPKPGNRNLYYIFTADDAFHQFYGYAYSEVDMTLNGGLGDVNTHKNVALYAPGTEKLVATRDANGVDVWVITKSWGNDDWRVYKVDCDGVHTTPVISHGGSIHNEVTSGTAYGALGCIKVSPDGARLVSTRYTSNTWELLDFNNATGVLSGGLSFWLPPYPTTAAILYGIEFSPNSKFVYTGGPVSNGNIYQYDVSVYNAVNIQSSVKTVGTDAIGGLQLGPDNKIYCALAGGRKLGVINAPDMPGTACNYVAGQIDLKQGTNRFGLPAPLIARFKAFADFNHTPACMDTPVTFTDTSPMAGMITGWSWNFGDGASSVLSNPVHTYSPGGSYQVKYSVKYAGNCTADTVKTITIASASISAGNDTIAAINYPLQLRASGGSSYTWSPGTGLDNPFSATPIARLDHDMEYYLTGITAEGCTGYDTLHIKVYKGPAVYVPNAFTPNGDAANDVLRPILIGIKKLDYFAVYNRAGQLIYRTTTPGKGWNGTLNGLPQPPCAYVWIVQAQDYLGALHRQKGVVVLLR